MIKGARKAGRSWEPEEDKQLREMVEAGKSVTLMALRHRRTEEAIRQRLHLLDIHLRETEKPRRRAPPG
jgi:hypothetical protein